MFCSFQGSNRTSAQCVFVDSNRLGAIEGKFRDLPFNTPADDVPRLESILRQWIHFYLGAVSAIMFGDHYVQSRSNPGAVPIMCFGVAIVFVTKMRVFSTRTCDALSFQLEV